MSKRKRGSDNQPADEAQPPRPPPKENSCNFWVKGKRKYCHLGVAPTHLFCGQHAEFEDRTREGFVERPGFERIPCPYDNGHNIAAKDLQKHLKKCNKRPGVTPSYFVENINVAIPPSPSPQPPSTIATEPTPTPRSRLLALPLPAFAALSQKISSIHSRLLPQPLRTLILTHPSMSDRIEQSHEGKHAVQQASLVGHMERAGLLKKGNVFVEFGAGKGELSRQKYDAMLDHAPNTTRHRLLTDIKDLSLPHYTPVTDSPVVAISKHLCGAATDLTLRCLSSFESATKSNQQLKGMVIALCCHHNCSWECYVDHGFLQKVGLDKEEFELLCVMSSWATCGTKEQREAAELERRKNTSSNPDSDTESVAGEGRTSPAADDADAEEAEHWTGLPFSARETLGQQCKRILDVGRAAYVRETMGMDADLVYYIERENSLENVALVVTRRGEGGEAAATSSSVA
ncbi:methyltransferase TRM13-domain-containing protein [Fimicolochytrium jonesii]|uniref:methyltransferase TRM13-domain-containing protein n=1 Tax=Fimicolochytrium jonesii TaxID=1396493 RepID=UPI0022FEB90B|nr:methyltransferase TRM13-domain-containing protein [Fimicolochytrium jonesii]KAI8817049.1 methyltransferase TRM13-domain-containing protein [Fimicolochytrium jonesii]